jgi:membrane protease YdiL (CAAX protease family)
VTTAPPTETWVEVDDPELAVDDVPVSRDVTTRRIVVVQLLVVAAIAAVSLALSVLDLDRGPDRVLQAGAKLASAAVALSVVDRLGWYRRVGFCGPRRWKRLWLAWLPALYVVFALAPGLDGRGALAALGVAGFAITIAFEEELWTRGLFLETLRWRGTTAAVVLSALWFGALHSLNLLSGQSAASTVAQIGVATGFGLALGAVRVRTGTLWLPIALHALFDFGILVRQSEEISELAWGEVPGALALVALPLAVFGLVLARPSKVPGPDGRMPRRRVKVEPWAWPESSAEARAEAANVLGRWPAPPPDLVEQWYRR